MTSPVAAFFTQPQSCNACDRFFRREKGSTRKLVDAGRVRVISSRVANTGRTCYYVDPSEVARAFGGQAVPA